MKNFDLNILPIAKGTFSNTKVTLAEIAVQLKSGTVAFATRVNPDGSETDVFLVTKGSKLLKEGKSYTVGNAKNKRPYGNHVVSFATAFSIKSGVVNLGDTMPGTMAYSDAMDFTAVVFTIEA